MTKSISIHHFQLKWFSSSNETKNNIYLRFDFIDFAAILENIVEGEWRLNEKGQNGDEGKDYHLWRYMRRVLSIWY